MLKIEQLRYCRGDFLLEADMTIETGERVAVIGPSGGGKSTLLALIAGFEAADRGHISWNETDLTALAPARRPITMLFQDNNLFPHLDILTNVALGINPSARPGAEALAIAGTALDEVGLSEFAARRPGGLSGGQQSRAALARALVSRRKLVLLDEPFAALGPALRADMLDLLPRLLPDATILMVTHDPEDALGFAARTVFVTDGNVDSPQPTRKLIAEPDARLAAYLRR